MRGGFKNRFAIVGAVLAAAAFAGGAYAATEAGPNSRQAFMNDVAKRLNVSPDQLKAALKGALMDRINDAVKAGRLTQAQANAIEKRLGEGRLPLFFGPPHGHARFERRGPLTAAARYLGLTDVQLLNELDGGKSLARVAKEKGKTTAGLEQAMTADFKARLDKAIAAGRITKAQGHTILNRFQARLDRRVNRTAPRFGGLHAAPDGGPPAPGGAPPPGAPPPPGGAPGMLEGAPPPPPAA